MKKTTKKKTKTKNSVKNEEPRFVRWPWTKSKTRYIDKFTPKPTSAVPIMIYAVKLISFEQPTPVVKMDPRPLFVRRLPAD